MVLHYLCAVSDISEGKPKLFSVRNDKSKGIEIVLFNIEGKFYAISNRCVHEGGPLNKRVLEGYVVTYPWHGWKYSVIDGKAPHERGDSVRSYEIKVIEGCIYLINSTSSI
ncbi:MAG: Rieske 2Fe-2S domain-containing protein [Nitrososphaeraceae archaeon]